MNILILKIVIQKQKKKYILIYMLFSIKSSATKQR